MTASAGEAADRTTTSAAMAAPGLRERRRRQTMAEISEAALTLFEERGLEAATVDDIAEAAGISQRTFFRYFAAKEDAALPAHREFEDAVEAGLGQADPEADPCEELGKVYGRALQAFADNASAASQRMLRVSRLLRREPLLRAALVRHSAARNARLFQALAAKFAGPQADDLQLRVAVELCTGLARAAFDTWTERLEAGRPARLPEIFVDAQDAAQRVRTAF
ncbi:TetR family transcriptional regulator [Arthrobacter sp. I2-34]|uniref:TetR family transcriptional regulator n=1 Tax=Arthrobacter hankyongi TaxID=2904801 RepID=A0ABS9L2R6_9MICC|nr:TetR family transcriptional regulator [Arthrobacter hankyongi]MCG2620942.1 TetR family transcriptional regulator [Arthrobacter hankyongi]